MGVGMRGEMFPEARFGVVLAAAVEALAAALAAAGLVTFFIVGVGGEAFGGSWGEVIGVVVAVAGRVVC